MTPVTIPDEAGALLRSRLGSSGLKRPVGWIAMYMSGISAGDGHFLVAAA